MLGKVQTPHQAQQICLGANTGEDFLGTQWLHAYHNHTHGVFKTGPKRTQGDITMAPKYGKTKNQNYVQVLMVIRSGDSHDDKLATNG